MTLITFQDGKPVLRDGKVGTEQECCCGCSTCLTISGRLAGGSLDVLSGCTGSPSQAQDEADINSYLDLLEQTAQDIADNLTAAGWTATVTVADRTVQTSYVECPECESNECYEIRYTYEILITATCECCIELPELPYANCGINNDCELFDQPEGRWVNIWPLTELPYPPGEYIPVMSLGPDCAEYAPLTPLYGINGDYGVDIGDGSFSALWVPVCTDSEWCANPLP
jgi:hypothetical protein